MAVEVVSFGYGHKRAPKQAHIVEDVRDRFRDPHVDPAMRQMTGKDQAVHDNVMRQPGAREFVVDLARRTEAVAAANGGRAVVAVGCVGGRHRSVVLAAALGLVLRQRGLPVVVRHRDVRKDVIKR